MNLGEAMIAAGPALVETYAVLTRLPSPHRLAPADAHRLLQANFAGGEVATPMGTLTERCSSGRWMRGSPAGGRMTRSSPPARKRVGQRRC